jgi:tRNA nucleotidyltransferase (CCA-adding enzyme)
MLAVITSHLGRPEMVRFLDSLNIHTLNGYHVREQILALNQARAAAIALHGEEYPATPDEERREVSCGEIRRLILHCEADLLVRLLRSIFDAVSHQPKIGGWLQGKLGECGAEDGPPQPLLLGRHLLEMGLKPGPRIGAITRAVYEKQLDGDVRTLDEARAAAQRFATPGTP